MHLGGHGIVDSGHGIVDRGHGIVDRGPGIVVSLDNWLDWINTGFSYDIVVIVMVVMLVVMLASAVLYAVADR